MLRRSTVRVSYQHLPAEIYARIALWACMDGGPTALSLSLVSRFVSASTSRYKLQSVSLSGLSAISSFFSLVRDRAPAHRRVRHLYLCDRSTKQLSSAIRHARMTPDPVTGIPHFEEYQPKGDSAGEAEVVLKLCSTLFALIAGNLCTLSCVIHDVHLTGLFRAISLFPLPVLEALSIRIPDNASPDSLLPSGYNACLPKLSYLHYSSGKQPYQQLFVMPAFISATARSLVRMDLMELGSTHQYNCIQALYCLLTRDPPLLSMVNAPFGARWFEWPGQRESLPHLSSSVRSIRVQTLEETSKHRLTDYEERLLAKSRGTRDVTQLDSATRRMTALELKEVWLEMQYDEGTAPIKR
jgi:hypothetical protein